MTGLAPVWKARILVQMLNTTMRTYGGPFYWIPMEAADRLRGGIPLKFPTATSPSCFFFISAHAFKGSSVLFCSHIGKAWSTLQHQQLA
ncbi:hypothetical protein H6P81_014098 [Aristolochia fimbriata]|uniref:Uncharacterized protein n=1 Tax=Aristolochia fimbriata TaxID=158543 RepID=A0AAV7EIP5_ARIFI|nr:hypothetical protein H6P81_014098 [Aristolochia fimbriata]